MLQPYNVFNGQSLPIDSGRASGKWWITLESTGSFVTKKKHKDVL